MSVSTTATSVEWGGAHYYGKMHEMCVEQLVMLRLVEYDKELTKYEYDKERRQLQWKGKLLLTSVPARLLLHLL